jgi:tetratricopeptide (TPR) repeat protein
LGNLARAEGRYDEALRHYGEADAAYAAKLGQDHRYRAKPIHEAGVTEYDRGHFDAALDDFNRALALRERTPPPDRPEIAQTLDARALALAATCRTQEALADSERAVAIRRKVLPYPHSATVDGLRHLAMIRQLAGQPGVGDLLVEARARARTATMYSKKPELMSALEAEIADPAVAAKMLGCKR